MKAIIKMSVGGLLFLSASISLFAQCEILNRVAPDGSMQYFMEPVNFYWTSVKSLKGCIVTDKESYFLELHPLPFPEKPAGNKLKKELVLKLANGETYKLKHFDTRYVDNDTVMEMLYLISKKDIDFLLVNGVSEIMIDMMGDEGIRSYELQLHKSALKEQLDCFLNEEKDRKKK
jgi:hypothetical protein